MRGLTIKQEKFAQGLFAGLSQREAYKQSYNAVNMKDTTIDRMAFDLANDRKVTARIAELTDELKQRNMVTVEKVLSELAKIGFADIKHYLQYKTAKTVVDHDKETGEPIIDYRQIVDVIDSADVDGSVIQEISIGKDGTFKFKLHDKMAALDKMGKHLGMFVDKVDNTIRNPEGEVFMIEQKHNLDNLSIDELKKLQELVSKVASE